MTLSFGLPVSPVSVAFICLLAVAALTDFFRQRISNWIVLALVGIFLVQAYRHQSQVAWADQVSAGALCLLAGLALYMFNQLGAGDAKLLAALALWTGLSAFVPVLFLISIAGLVFVALLLGARRLIDWRNWDPHARLPKSLRSGEGIPYGVAIAAGAVLGARFIPQWLWT